MHRIFTAFLLLFFSFQGFSQGKSDPTTEEIQRAKELKSAYEDENIVVVSKNIEVTFDFNKKEGLVEAYKTKEVSLMNISSNSRIQYSVFYDSESEVEDFELKDRRNRNLKEFHSGIRDEYVNSQNIFHGDYRKQYVNLVFPLQGTKYNIQTKKKYKDVKYFVRQYFSSIYRIVEGKLTIHIPNWLDLDVVEYNFEGFDIKKTETKNSDGETIVYTFKNIPPQPGEQNSPGPSYVYPHVVYHAKSYTHEGISNDLFNSVDDLYAWCNGLVEEVEIDPSVFSAKVDELTAKAKTDKEKIENIYYWVQDNIRYIAFEDGIAGFQPDSPQNVFNKRYGDCKGMAFLTQAMLQEAGFDSRLVWIGTDRIAYDYSIPSLAINNHMICAVKLDDELIFLDATEKYNQFGTYATRIQGKQAMVQNGDSYKIVTVPSATTSGNIDKVRYELKIQDGFLVGTAERIFQNESRVMFQNNYTSFDSGDQLEVLSNFLTTGNNNYMVESISPFDPEIRNQDLKLQYSLKIGNAISEFDGTIYLDIDPEKNTSGWIFRNRKSGYKFHMKQKEFVETQLEIPSGYQVKSLPQDFSVSNEMVDISLNYELSDNKIIYQKQVNFKKRLIDKSDFETWNVTFDSFLEKLSRQIILVKQS
ncbi:MAG TPA: transglutaminase domain-containing protein [Flavobacteriaceae bacterium]|nr:transglutaminase domain-containing protein [Flavobacteriaceae bacterium]